MLAPCRHVTSCLLFVLLFCLSIPLLARQQPSTGGGATTGPQLPVVVASAAGERVRFTAPGATAAQIRMQVVSTSGEVVYDSSWKDGNVLDWASVDTQGQPLAAGTYRCVIDVKDLQGSVTERDAVLSADGERVALAPTSESEGMAIFGSDEGAKPKVTLLAHDGKDGAVVSTSGDLSFRFGDFLAGRDSERMRLTAGGDLLLNGMLHANGIVFPDGTTWSTAGAVSLAGSAVNGANAQPRAALTRVRPSAPPILALKPRTTTTTPQAQFVVGSTGVNVGTSNAAYTLTVTGDVSTGTRYDIGTAPVLSIPGNSTVIGAEAGHATTGTFNTFIGLLAGSANPSGSNNVFAGADAGLLTSSGGDNVFVGYQAGKQTSSGGFNTLIGSGAGSQITTETNDTLLGAYTSVGSGVTNATAIGEGAYASTNNTVILGNVTGGTSTGIGTLTPNQYLGVGGGITLDQNNTNNGTLMTNGVLAFGANTGTGGVSGEGIASQRTGTGNLYGLDFYTQYAKRMSIDNNGYVAIGTFTDPAYSLVIGGNLRTEGLGNFNSGMFSTLGIGMGATPPNGALLGVAGTIYLSSLATSGSTQLCVNSSNLIAFCSSSIRYKDDIADFDGGLDVVNQLRPVTFRWKSDGKPDVGLIAEQVKDVEPLLTTTGADGQVEGVKYDHLTVVLINAVKQLEEENKALRERVEKLERQADRR